MAGFTCLAGPMDHGKPVRKGHIMPARTDCAKRSQVRPSPQLQTAAAVFYLREVKNRRDPEPQPSQCRDVHAALMLSPHLARAGYVFGESIVFAPDMRPGDLSTLSPIGELSDFRFDDVGLIVQTTRPCLDDYRGQNRKPKYQSNHVIERAINQSLRNVFDWLCRERVSLADAVPLDSNLQWLKNVAYGLYHKRQDSLAEATRWMADGKECRMTGTTFGYIVRIRELATIHKPFLGLFGMSREDTFRLACSVGRFPGLIPELLTSDDDCLCVVQMDRPVDAPNRTGNVCIAQDHSARIILNAPLGSS